MPWWSNALMKQRPYEAMSWWSNTKMIKHPDKATPWWNNTLVKQCYNEEVSWGRNTLIKQCFGEAVPWWIRALLNQHLDEASRLDQVGLDLIMKKALGYDLFWPRKKNLFIYIMVMFGLIWKLWIISWSINLPNACSHLRILCQLCVQKRSLMFLLE